MREHRRVSIVYGHFGSGKTEFSINYALYLRKMQEKVALIDLDTINLYFRVRERQDDLEAMGLEILSSSIAKANNLDIPALDPRIYGPLQNPEYTVVVDAGGDPKGSLVLRTFGRMIQDSENIFVVNANRSETNTVEKVLAYMNEIGSYAGQMPTVLVNTTHLVKDTTPEDVLRGWKLVCDVSEATGLPVLYNATLRHVAEEMQADSSVDEALKEKLFPIDLFLRSDWMM